MDEINDIISRGLLMQEIAKMRERYKPSTINYLLIAESAPIGTYRELRFFYNPEQNKSDFLFEAVMEVVFPEFKTSYKVGNKEKYLRKFQAAGFYLINATDKPINKLPDSERREIMEAGLENKLLEIEGLIGKSVPIFLIKEKAHTHALYPYVWGPRPVRKW